MRLAPLVIRADSSDTIGSGHTMRCLAVAEEWSSRGGRVVFACHTLSGLARDRIQRSGFELAHISSEPDATKQVAAEVEAQWVILDLGARAHPQLRALGGDVHTLVVDDLGGSFPRPPTIVVNQNAHAPNTEYHGVPGNSTLLGLDYLLLRDEFLSVEPATSVAMKCSHVLLALGGSDPMGLLYGLAEALSQIAEWTVHVVMPSDHRGSADLRSLHEQTSQVALHVDPEMATLMHEMDLAVTSGGTTVWELAYLGIPAVVGAVSSLEERLTEGLNQLGLYHTIGLLKEVDPRSVAEIALERCLDREWRHVTNEQARNIIDGEGRRRVVDAMLERSEREIIG